MTRLRAAARVMITLGAVLVHAQSTAADFTIVQKNKAFSVRQIAIKVGDRITFVKDDSVKHSLWSEARGSKFDIVQPPGRSDTVRFSQPGTVEVECLIHPEMRLEVQVRR